VDVGVVDVDTNVAFGVDIGVVDVGAGVDVGVDIGVDVCVGGTALAICGVSSANGVGVRGPYGGEPVIFASVSVHHWGSLLMANLYSQLYGRPLFSPMSEIAMHTSPLSRGNILYIIFKLSGL
jgi:hypothetical protein